MSADCTTGTNVARPEREDIGVMLNRSAVVVRPKQPFLDWLHRADPTSGSITLNELEQDPTIYLIPGCDTEGDVFTVPRRTSSRSFSPLVPTMAPNCRFTDRIIRLLWSAALRKHSVKTDGIRYRSRRDPARVVYAIYECSRSTFKVTDRGSLMKPPIANF